MARDITMAGCRPGAKPSWLGAALRSAVATLLLAALAAGTGFRALDGTADNDSMLRLVEVRDLIAGQGWFDLHQYRMGLEDAPPMHWSRLVDAPIAAIVLMAGFLTGSQAAGETAALVAWPLALYGAALYFLLRIGRAAGGETPLFPLTIIGAGTLYFLGIFTPGTIDHHNVQLVLMLAMTYFLLIAPRRTAAPAAGIAAVLMLAVGMETVAYVAAGALCVATWFLLRGEEARSAAVGFGIAFAATSSAIFVATVPEADWGAVHCDAFSLAQFGVGALAGTGLALTAASRVLNRTLARRAAALAVLAAAIVILAAIYFPQCLADPYAGLPPVLRNYWLDRVDEAQPLWRLLATEPETVAGNYATVLIALALLGLSLDHI